MGTDYKVACKVCKVGADAFMRKAWGTCFPFEEAIETIKFVAKHTICCGEGSVIFISEHGCLGDLEYFEIPPDRLLDDFMPEYNHLVPLLKSLEIFSKEWFGIPEDMNATT